ncbi:hypothetical protein BDV39DRAFT_197645 [Aspergillus sergii]|uniref:Terpenoid synthase n=1 Tax=Aspergillus sergii TaxID=1034303 RepID=A0A5N6WL10_9EURO|nr:hypothetical protein BDV39DRAFT_197645 [Aspergillus sergii]
MAGSAESLPVDSGHGSSANETSIKAIQSFVAALGCDYSRFPLAEDQELLKAAERVIRYHVTSERQCRMLISRLSLGVGVAAHAYSTYPFNLERFAVNFGSDVSHSHSNLDYLAYLLVVELRKLWVPLACSCIVKSTLDLLSGCALEGRFPPGFERQAHGFPSYLRKKTEASEVYAFSIFLESLFSESISLGLYVHSIPGIIEVTNAVNDVISYYKQYVIGNEKNGPIVSEARVQMRQPAEVLYDICRDAGEADEQLQQTYCSFVDGLPAFNIISKRYRLSEVGISITAGCLICSPE